MSWDTKHLLAAIALLLVLFGGGAVWFSREDWRASFGGVAVAVMLLCVAMLVT